MSMQEGSGSGGPALGVGAEVVKDNWLNIRGC